MLNYKTTEFGLIHNEVYSRQAVFGFQLSPNGQLVSFVYQREKKFEDITVDNKKKITLINTRAEQLLQVTSQEVTGQTISSILPETSEAITRLLNAGEASQVEEEFSCMIHRQKKILSGRYNVTANDVRALANKVGIKKDVPSFLELYIASPDYKALAQSTTNETSFTDTYNSATLEDAKQGAISACQRRYPEQSVAIDTITNPGRVFAMDHENGLFDRSPTLCLVQKRGHRVFPKLGQVAKPLRIYRTWVFVISQKINARICHKLFVKRRKRQSSFHGRL